MYNPYLEDIIEDAYRDMQNYKINNIKNAQYSNRLPSGTLGADGELVSLSRVDDSTNMPVYKILDRNGKEVGVMSLMITDDSNIMMNELEVNPVLRDQGYCQSALRVLIPALKGANFSTLSFSTVGAKNKALIHILDKFGFTSKDDMMVLDVNTFDSTTLMRETKVFYTDAITEAGKEGVYKTGYVFRDRLQTPVVSPILAKEGNRDKVIDFVGTFIDTHNHELSTSGPVYTWTFGTKQFEPMYELFNTNADDLVKLYVDMVEDTYGGKIYKVFSGWVKAAPHKILLNAMIAEAIQKGYNEILDCCEYMYAFTEYPILYRKYWATGVKEEVMDYTIEHLGAKYKIKQCKTILELLKYDASTATKAFADKFETAEDNVYMDYMYRMRSQFNSKLRNISNRYYENSEKNLSQHTNVVQFDDGELADQEGNNANITHIIAKTVSKFASAEINNSFLKISAEKNQVKKDNLGSYIAQIFNTKNNEIPKFVEDIISVYFAKNTNSDTITPTEFLNFGLSLYRSIGTSKDPALMDIKRILNEKWMNEIIDIRSQYQREATVISYTRGIFDYMILMINYYNN